MKSVGSLERRCLVAATCLLLWGCGGTEWSNVTVAAPYRPPEDGINVSATANASGPRWEEAVSTVTTALVTRLSELGFEATVDMQSPGSDQLALNVTEWDPGSRELRYLRSFGAGQARIVITVDVKEPNGTTILHGSIRSYLNSGVFGGDARDALRAAGRSIADAVSTGRAD